MLITVEEKVPFTSELNSPSGTFSDTRRGRFPSHATRCMCKYKSNGEESREIPINRAYTTPGIEPLAPTLRSQPRFQVLGPFLIAPFGVRRFVVHPSCEMLAPLFAMGYPFMPAAVPGPPGNADPGSHLRREPTSRVDPLRRGPGPRRVAPHSGPLNASRWRWRADHVGPSGP